MAVSDGIMRHLHGTQGGETSQTVTLLPDPEPRPRTFTIVSVDDHLIEPAHVFEGRMPSHLADAAPKISASAADQGKTRRSITSLLGSVLSGQ